jgi:outer membrane protein assembly factor BamB
METKELMFVGLKGSVIALNRDTGERVWVAQLAGDFVNVTAEAGRVYAACHGEVFCLDPLTGQQLWHNPLKGFGLGLATMAFNGMALGTATTVAAQKDRQERAAAAAAAAG